MTPLFNKLNLGDRRRIHVLGAPDSFESALEALKGVEITREVSGAVDFAVAFVLTQAQLDSVSGQLIRNAEGDAVLWIAYPKASSKKYPCAFNRDSGWTVLGDGGFEPVRQVAIDEDWSALRFRRVEFIKRMARRPDRAISVPGRRKAGGGAAGGKQGP